MKFRNALVAATMLALPLAANAQPITGLYIGGGAGVNIMHDEDMPASAAPGLDAAQLKTRVGPAVDLAVGYGLGNGCGRKLKADYRYNKFGGAAAPATLAARNRSSARWSTCCMTSSA